MKKFDLSLLEIDPSDGVAVYYHSSDCPSCCDFACNGREGDVIAAAYNAVVAAQPGHEADLPTARQLTAFCGHDADNIVSLII